MIGALAVQKAIQLVVKMNIVMLEKVAQKCQLAANPFQTKEICPHRRFIMGHGLLKKTCGIRNLLGWDMTAIVERQEILIWNIKS